MLWPTSSLGTGFEECGLQERHLHLLHQQDQGPGWWYQFHPRRVPVFLQSPRHATKTVKTMVKTVYDTVGVFFGQVTWFHMCCFYVFTLSKKISPATLQKFFLGLEDVRRAFWSKYEARFCCWDTFFEIRIIRTGSHWRRWHRASRSMTG